MNEQAFEEIKEFGLLLRNYQIRKWEYSKSALDMNDQIYRRQFNQYLNTKDQEYKGKLLQYLNISAEESQLLNWNINTQLNTEEEKQ